MPKLPPELRKRLATLVLTGAGVATIATSYTAYHEGKVNRTYRDVTGTPTICYGHAGPDVRPGMVMSDADCLALLKRDMNAAFAAVDRHVTAPLTRGQYVALASYVFNVGVGNFQRSTLLRLINDGQMPAACKEFSRWVYSKGMKLPGLEARRAADEWLCRFDLPQS